MLQDQAQCQIGFTSSDAPYYKIISIENMAEENDFKEMYYAINNNKIKSFFILQTHLKLQGLILFVNH